MHTFVIPLGFDLVPLTIFAFALALAFCVAGLFYSGYLENWPQSLGMVAVGIASALKMEQIRLRGFVSGETTLLAIGIALFAAGVAFKVWQHAHCQQPRPRKRRHSA